MKTLKEIEERLAQIKAELETRKDLTEADLAAFENETKDLVEARNKMLAEQEETRKQAERRSSLLSAIAGNSVPAKVVRTFNGDNNDNKENDDKYGSMEYRKAFMAHVVRGAAIPAEYRADAVTKTSDVGAVIPTTVLNKVIEKLEAVGMILPLVTRTSYKGGVSIPYSAVKPTASWVSEGAGSDKQKRTVGSVTFAYHKLRCAIAVSLEVDNLALSAFEAAITNSIVEAMTKAIEQAIINGDGSGKPSGILAETVNAGQEVEVTAVAYKDLVDAEAALPQAYEASAKWCMSKKTFMAYAGMTDGNGQPIGRVTNGIGGKIERYLLGRPVVCCDYVTSFGSAEDGEAFAFIFNFADYVLNTNYNMGVKKYEDNDTDDLITKAVMLVDGKVVDKNSLVILSKKN